MELKGQMIHVPESCSLMFLGSPRVDKLEELMGRGLHLSDIPIHDATRDVILVGEQAKAQDGLKKRMDKLKVGGFIYLKICWQFEACVVGLRSTGKHFALWYALIP